MSTTETAVVVKPRNVNIEFGKVYSINLPNGTSLIIEGNTVTLPDGKPETKPTEATQAETPAPRKGGFRGKAKEETKAAAPVETPPPAAAAAAAAEKPAAAAADSSAKQTARKNTGQSTWANSVIQDDKFKGLATFNTKKGPKDVAILGKGDKKYKLGFLMETRKGQAYCWKSSVFFVALDDARLSDIELL